jgi:cyanate permease
VSGRVLIFIFGGSVVFPPLLGALVDSAGSWRPLWATCAGMVAVAALVLGAGVRGHEAGTLTPVPGGP